MPAAEEMTDMRLVLRGSLITLRRRCGRRGCHCAHGELHETPALSLNVDGKTKILTLRSMELPEIEAALARYKQARAALDQQVRAGVATLQARRERPKTKQPKAAKKGAP